MSAPNELLNNLDKLHTTELGVVRIKKNLSLETDDVVGWCREKIKSDNSVITRNGKNWYVHIDACIITVNAYSYTIITAHKQKFMKRILVTGGTTFVSKYVAEYFVNAGYEVYVLNRNTKPQVQGVKLIEGDRHNLNGILKAMSFDVVADITAYNEKDIVDFVKELGSYGQYIMISSSAVYPEYGAQPFLEESEKSVNKYWGAYGTDKIAAEKALLERVKDAYILRPPYLYGPMNNVYREAFVFDCALADRKFYLPKDGEMKLQFFHVKDLCKLMEVIIKDKPKNHIFNVGNPETVSIKEWVTKCYEVLGKIPAFVNVYDEIEQRNYFSFYNYEYCLDVSRQCKIYPETIALGDGLREAAEWYLEHSTEVKKKSFFEFIDGNLAGR